jgi:hypothetical protein
LGKWFFGLTVVGRNSYVTRIDEGITPNLRYAYPVHSKHECSHSEHPDLPPGPGQIGSD